MKKNMNKKPKILVFVGFYLPGFKAGGPLRTIANLVEHLGNDFDFWIVTRDRDLGDKTHYPNINLDNWNEVGKAHVLYLSLKKSTISNITYIINSTPHDILYLNSFFDVRLTILPLIARFFNKTTKKKPLILAPRGVFSIGALNIKKYRKVTYILLVRYIKLYANITWQASSHHELTDIVRVLKVKERNIKIALDLPSLIPDASTLAKPMPFSGKASLRLVFISRISPMKNLDFALHVLEKVESTISFDIYGPIENIDYWEQCQKIIKNLPKNISVNYCGPVLAHDVSSVFSKYDLFLFPSRGENYGHVIAESLSVGTPVLISNNTPWRDLKVNGFGWNLPTNDIILFIKAINDYSKKTQLERASKRKEIRKKIQPFLMNPTVIKDNKKLFLDLLP